jgi:hypothetical protein
MKTICLAILLALLSTESNAQDPDFAWANFVGGTDDDEASSIITDALGNVITTGWFEGSVDFDPGAALFNMTSNGSKDIYIQKLNAEGNLVWAKTIGGRLDDYGYSITADALGNVYITGKYSTTVDFNPSTAIYNLTSNGGYDDFILKLDVGGHFVWAKSMGGTDDDEASSINIDALGNVHTTGWFKGSVDFDPGILTFNLTSNGVRDIFIQKLDANGSFIWAKSIGGLSDDRGISITNDSYGNIYTTGVFVETVDFDPGAGTFYLTSNQLQDIFIQKLDPSGNFVWAKSIEGIEMWIRSITSDFSGDVYVTGTFRDTVDFDPGATTYYLSANGYWDAFIQKLN